MFAMRKLFSLTYAPQLVELKLVASVLEDIVRTAMTIDRIRNKTTSTSPFFCTYILREKETVLLYKSLSLIYKAEQGN